MNDSCTVNCKSDDVISLSRKKISSYKKLDKTSNYFKLLSNNTRLKVLLILIGEEMCVCDIAESIRLSVPATSQQLKMLKQAGILVQRNAGKTVYYSYANEDIEKMIKMLIFQIVK